MAQYFFESRDDFHYDNSGYYGYIVFNGDERTLGRLRNALGQGRQSHGLGWYRYGKSFRPANDSKMYDWYIRLHSGGNDKPAAKDVDDFLRRFLQPPSPKPRPPETQKLVQELLQETLEHYEKSVAELRQGFSELKSGIQVDAATLTELEELRRRVEAAEEAKEKAEQAQVEAENALSMTQVELEAVRTESPGDQFWHQKYNDSEATIQRLKKELKSKANEVKSLTNDFKRLQRDYSDIASAQADTQRAQDVFTQALERINDHDRHISEDLTRLHDNVKRLADRDGPDKVKEGQSELPSRFEALEQGLGERLAVLESTVSTGIAAQTDLAEMRSRLKEAMDAKETAERAREEAESELEAKMTQLRSLQNEGPGDRYWHEKYNESEEVNRKLNRDIKALDKDVKDLERDLNNAEEARDNYATQFLETSKKIGEMEKAASASQLPPVVPARNNTRANKDDLGDILEGAFPGMIFIEDSLDTLYRGIENYRSVMALLHRIKNEPLFNGRNAMHGGKQISKWREDTIDKRGRIYFCKESRLLGDKIVVYISVKNEQESKDENWLMRNPPDHCLEKALAQRT